MNKTVLRTTITAFLAAIICVCGFFKVMVPGLQGGIVIQNAMCVLTAVILGGVWGAGPAALFFIVGVAGVPIFAGWRGGFSVLIDINGGYRVGWVIGALVAGLISGKASMSEKKVTVKYAVRLSLAVLSGMLALYIPEVFYVLGYKAGELGAGGALKLFVTLFFAPFLPVDFCKAVVAVLLALKIRPVVGQYLYDETEASVNESDNNR